MTGMTLRPVIDVGGSVTHVTLSPIIAVVARAHERYALYRETRHIRHGRWTAPLEGVCGRYSARKEPSPGNLTPHGPIQGISGTVLGTVLWKAAQPRGKTPVYEAMGGHR